MPLLRRLRPYGTHAFLLVYAPLILFADGAYPDRVFQVVLGLLTFAVLALVTLPLGRRERHQAWICVPVATLFEVFGSLIWGGYTYQFHNIPLYVPPGHALVYVFGITAGALPIVAPDPRRFARAVLAVATTWTIAGVTVLPLTGHRLDLVGAALWPLLAWCLLRSRRATMFAGIWIATATLELAGTTAGAWTWAAAAPWSHLASGNPPSAIAAGYAVIDGTVALVAGATLAVVVRLRRRGAVEPEPATA